MKILIIGGHRLDQFRLCLSKHTETLPDYGRGAAGESRLGIFS
jgi:hypothetical protein